MPSPARILLAESDTLLSASLCEQLQREGYDVTTVCDADAARQAAITTSFAFAILAHPLDGADSERLAGDLRNDGMLCPVLLLIEGETTTALPSLTRPLRFSALLAKLHTLSMHHGSGDTPVRIGPYTFHPSAKLLQAGARKVRLTEKETNILKFLHAKAGTVPRDILLHEVWGYGPAVATHTLETHIYRLRKKIEEDPAHAQILLTEDGGYRLSV